jgi:hypothetical protein
VPFQLLVEWSHSNLTWEAFTATFNDRNTALYGYSDPPHVFQQEPNYRHNRDHNNPQAEPLFWAQRLQLFRESDLPWTIYISSLPRLTHRYYLSVPPQMYDPPPANDPDRLSENETAQLRREYFAYRKSMDEDLSTSVNEHTCFY